MSHDINSVNLLYDIGSVRPQKDRYNVLMYFETDIAVVPYDKFAENAFV